jgi:RHS repeat-associated protein
VGAGQYDQAFAYSPVGNLTTMAGTSQWYSDTAHVHAVTHVGGTRKFWYDANGNEITRTVGAVTYGQTWDAENRLTSISAGGVVTTYTYNGDGARVKVASGGSATVYVGSTYEVITSTGVTTTYYYLGATRVAMRTSAGVTWLQGDHLGSASLATNSAGAKVSDERYYPFGGTRSGSMPTDYQFTGQKVDGGTGLYYYGARYYDPVTGRFISADTVVPDPAKSQSLNRYAYVHNNPMRFTDPSGHVEEDEASQADEQLAWLLETYGIKIPKDYGWRRWGGERHWYAGAWTMDDIQKVGKGATDLAGVMGGAGVLKERLGGVSMSRREMESAGLGMLHHVILHSVSSYWGTWTVVHELSHAWDGANWGAYSWGLMQATGGYYQVDPPNPGSGRGEHTWTSTYRYGGTPPKGSDDQFNAYEDFAESVTTFVYPGAAQVLLQGMSPEFRYADYFQMTRALWLQATFGFVHTRP